MMFSLLLLLFLVVTFGRKTFSFEKLTRIRFFLIPLYGAAMTLFSFDSGISQPLLLVLTGLAAVVIGWLQTRSAVISDTHTEDRYGRPIIRVKKGLSFLLGWGAVFLIGLLIEAAAGHSLAFGTILRKGIDDLEYDTLFYKVFATHNTTPIWLLVSLSSLSYIFFLIQKNPAIRLAIGRKQKKTDR